MNMPVAIAEPGDAIMAEVRAIWLDLLADLMRTVQLTIDADYIVF